MFGDTFEGGSKLNLLMSNDKKLDIEVSTKFCTFLKKNDIFK